MIDICIIIHRNYSLLGLQLAHWSWITGDKQLLVCDNTHQAIREPLTIASHSVPVKTFTLNIEGTDGETHGGTLDYLLRQTTTPIVGIVDSDFFWLKQDILKEIEELLAQGNRCVGVEHWYDDFEKVNRKFPDRASYLAPSVFGIFVERDLAISVSMISTRQEGATILAEGGWRLRRKVIDEKIPHHLYRVFQYPEQTDRKTCYFGQPENPVGVHLLKGSGQRRRITTTAYHEAMELAQKHTKWQPPQSL